MKKNLLLLFILVNTSFVFAQNELNPSDWKMTQAKLLFEDNKFKDALDIYLELSNEYNTDAFLNFRISLCYFEEGKLDQSNEYCKKALDNCHDNNLKKEIIYLQANIYHKQENFVSAKDCLNGIMSGTATVDSNQVKLLLKQINVAEELYKNPVNCNFVAIPVESEINSEFNEIFPVCSRRGNKLFFTSDRQIAADQERNAITHNFPNSIFESEIDQSSIEGLPVLVDETFASGKNYILGSVSAADMIYFLYKETPENNDGGDLYTDTRDTDEDFTDPVKIESVLNTKYYEYSPSYDCINAILYYVSNFKDIDKTKSDIFKSELFKSRFPEPDMLKKTSYDNDQAFVYVHPGGGFMVFAMDGETSMGGYDLFICYDEDGKWSEPENMGYPVNTSSDEMQFCLSSDGLTAYISSNRPLGAGGFDIYKFDFLSVIGNKTGLNSGLVNFYGQITGDEGEFIQTELEITDKNNKKNKQVISSDEYGYYSYTVKAGSIYNLEIKNKMYEEYSEEIDASDQGGKVFEKDIDLIIKP